MVQYNLGSAYFKRVRGAKRQNIECAIACYEKALQVYTRQALPLDCAKVLANLGSAYVERVEGERQANLEKAITYYEAASQVYTRDTFPLDYAFIQDNLGSAYIERVGGERQANLERAIAFYEAASQVYTCDAFPIEHRQTQIRLANVEAQRKNWASAHEAYEKACAAEELLVHVSAGVVGRDIVLREGDNASTYNGFSLLQLDQVEAAALAIELGRARGLAEALALDTTSAGRINDAIHRKLYEHARQTLIEAQIAVNTPLPQELTAS